MLYLTIYILLISPCAQTFLSIGLNIVRHVVDLNFLSDEVGLACSIPIYDMILKELGQLDVPSFSSAILEQLAC